MSMVKEFVGHDVKIVTADGRSFLGNLEGYDQNVNLILTQSKERVFKQDKPTVDIDLGIIVLRGDDIVCIGEIDDSIEGLVDYKKIQAKQLRDTENRC